MQVYAVRLRSSRELLGCFVAGEVPPELEAIDPADCEVAPLSNGLGAVFDADMSLAERWDAFVSSDRGWRPMRSVWRRAEAEPCCE